MNNKLTALLTTAVVTGLLAGQAARAEEKPAAKNGEMAADKNCCKGDSKKMGKCHKGKKKGKDDKNGCAKDSCHHESKDGDAPAADEKK